MSNYLDTRDLYKRQCELQEALDTLETELQDAQDELEEMQGTLEDAESEKEYSTGEEREELDTQIGEAQEAVDAAKQTLSTWQEEYQEELIELDDLETDVGREWMHGETLIPEDEFTAYAQNLAEETGALPADAGWPIAGNIDWDQAADELKQDYTTVTYQGTDYLFRS